MYTECRIMIGGKIFRIYCRNEKLPRLYKKYLTEEHTQEEYAIIVTKEECEQEQMALEKNAFILGKEGIVFTWQMAENAAVYRKITTKLIQEGTVPLHSSAICWKDRGILFAAPSGTGKSTHVGYWKTLYGDNVTVINDDKPLIRTNTDGKCQVYGTPWAGRYGRNENTVAPLNAICFLHRGKENAFRKFEPGEEVPELLQCVFRPRELKEADLVMNAVHRIISTTEFYKIHCTNDPSAAAYVRERLSMIWNV